MARRRKIPSSVLSLGAIVVVLLVGVVYILVSVLRVEPFKDYRTITIAMSGSGGIEINSPVLVVGNEVGKVTDLRIGHDGGAGAATGGDAHPPPPADSTMSVENLSALSEPYMIFRPNSADGPELRDGQRVDTHESFTPVTISDTAGKAVTLLEQFDPDAISSLVATLREGLDGTETVMPALQRSARLLAQTLIAKNPDLTTLLTSVQRVGGDLSWLGPALPEGGPSWESLGTGIISQMSAELATLAEQRDPAEYTNPTGMIPFLTAMNEVLVEIGPSLKPLGPALQPVVDQSATALARLDIGELLTQALGTVGSDGVVRLQLDVSPR